MLGSFHVFERTTGSGTQKNLEENQSGFLIFFNIKNLIPGLAYKLSSK